MRKRHLLNGVAVIAALAFSAPVWAQAASPSGGNAMGMPGPNPGGGGLTPYSTGAPTSATAAPSPASSSATPPMHRHAHHVARTAPHKKMAPLTGNSAAQLNQQELARIQTGSSMPPSAPMPNPSAGNTMGMPGPNAGGPGPTPYSSGFPHESEHGTVQR